MDALQAKEKERGDVIGRKAKFGMRGERKLTTIFNPDPTSFTDKASSMKPNVEKYLSHLRTGGMLLILTKKLK
jgi:hypothetical protein